jgi:hypothetical protein
MFVHEQRYRDLAAVAGRRITICGAGALGANLAETLARMGLRQLRVIDRDRVEARNLATQPWQMQDVGAAKAKLLATLLYRAVAAPVEACQVELTPANARKLLAGSAVAVDAFDNIPARRAVSDAALALALPCLHIALGGAGDYGACLWDEAYQLPEAARGPDDCDYPLTRPLVLLVAAAAAEIIVTFLRDGTRRNCEITLRDLRMNSLVIHNVPT